MSYMKRYLEDVSVELGYRGEINDLVLALAKLRLAKQEKEDQEEDQEEGETNV